MPAFLASEEEVLANRYLGTAGSTYKAFLALLTAEPAGKNKSTKAQVFAAEKLVTEEWAAYTRYELLTASKGKLTLVKAEPFSYYENTEAITFPTTAGMGAKEVKITWVAIWDVATLSEAGNPISYAKLETPLTINKAVTPVEFAAGALKLGAE